MSDELTRECLWQYEHKIVSCYDHIIGLPVLDIKKVRTKVECGKNDCNKEAVYEVKLQ